MPKAPTKRTQSKAGPLRHEPLEKQLLASEERGKLREKPHAKKQSRTKATKKRGGNDDDDDDDEEEGSGYVTSTISRKIIEQAAEQQREIEEEDDEEEDGGMRDGDDEDGKGDDDDEDDDLAAAKMSRNKIKSLNMSSNSSGSRGGKNAMRGGSGAGNDDDDDDAAGGERKQGGMGGGDDDDEDGGAGGYDEGDVQLTEEDEKALAMFMPKSTGSRMTLADMIAEKLKQHEAAKAAGGAGAGAGGAGAGAGGAAGDIPPGLDPKVVETFSLVGKYLSKYTSGKIPKVFKVIPTLKNWEEVLFLTRPDSWTVQAMSAATRLFAANLNVKLAQRFYNLVLLPRVKEDIETNKRLNYHLYESIRRTIFKPAAFFKGILLPLAEFGCTPREAVILASILSKCSIPADHAAVALIKLTQLPYSGPSTLFIKALLNKKYSLPLAVLARMCDYFAGFADDKRDLPVLWHNTLLVFVQRYKHDLSAPQKHALRELVRKRGHHAIGEEVRRELLAQAPQQID